jgi:hypothetical protein
LPWRKIECREIRSGDGRTVIRADNRESPHGRIIPARSANSMDFP